MKIKNGVDSMGASNFKALGKPFRLFLVIDFLIPVLSFIGTAQFANECYQGMFFAGLAALFAWLLSLVYWMAISHIRCMTL